MDPVAIFRSPFSGKFGIPRQSGLAADLPGEVHLVGEYRNPDALRGLDQFDYIWLIWGFSANGKAPDAPWKATVRPPGACGCGENGLVCARCRPDGRDAGL